MGSDSQEKSFRRSFHALHIAGWVLLIVGSFLALIEGYEGPTHHPAAWWYALMERWGGPLMGLAIILGIRFSTKRWVLILLGCLAAAYVATMLVLDYHDPVVML